MPSFLRDPVVAALAAQIGLDFRHARWLREHIVSAARPPEICDQPIIGRETAPEIQDSLLSAGELQDSRSGAAGASAAGFAGANRFEIAADVGTSVGVNGSTDDTQLPVQLR